MSGTAQERLPENPIMNESRPNALHACLDQSVLKAYNLGTMPEVLLEQVASHLAVCPNCESVLEAIRGDADPLVHNLRRYLRADPPIAVDAGAETGVDLQPAPPNYTANILAGGLSPLPRRFGAYQVLERLAVGGMSYVFKARQFHPNRLVALKFPHCAPLPGVEAFERFQREVDAIAQLEHEHIVRIYECGEEEGQCYFSMEYMGGGSLAVKLHPSKPVGQAFQPDASGSQAGKPDLPSGSPLSEREAAELVQTLAQTMQFAHEHDIIHRDLKPANVLLAADGTVKLSDFGLAKWLSGDDALTQSHTILGTAKYMAPEQARGDTEQIGVRTDVYGLGTILYECLTGRAPFQASTETAILLRVQSTPPIAPSQLRPGLCRNLEAVCLKCLAKDPKERYASAKELADDLGRWLRGEATVARPERWSGRLRRMVRRHWALTTTAALALAAAIILPVAAYVRSPERELESIERALQKGEEVTLIGDTGKPRWFRIRISDDRSQVSLAEDKTFTVESFPLCLVELVRRPPSVPYRLYAEICHESGREAISEAGIYLGHCAYPASKPKLHVFTRLSFDGVHDKTALQPRGNAVELSPLIYAPGELEMYQQVRVGGAQGAWFQRGRLPFPWRAIEVVVTPQSLEAFRDGQRVGELSAAQMTNSISGALTMLRGKHKFPNDSAHDVPSDFPPSDFHWRGSLGLYVYGGLVHFRSVRITPLTQAP
jgi:serine/threonine-protein kinase